MCSLRYNWFESVDFYIIVRRYVMRNYKNLFLSVFIILTLIIILQIFEPSMGTKISNTLTIFTTIVGFVSVFFEMKRAAI